MSNNTHLVIGLGETGFSCVNYLVSKNISVIIADSREHPPKLHACREKFPRLPILLGKFTDAVFSQARTIVVSPGVSLEEPCIRKARENGAEIIGDVELFVRAAKAPIVAITGSNGKSTLTTLMGELINHAGKKAVVCGNIGVPVLDCLSLPTPDYYVIELSSFQLDTTYSLKAEVAVVINVSADHMDRYKTFDDYLHSKRHIYDHCRYAVINADEKNIWEEKSFSHPPLSFTLQSPANPNQFGIQNGYLVQGENKLIKISELLLQQRHNNQNYLAALAMGKILKLPMKSMLETVKTFGGLPHRCQRVPTKDGVIWYNDSKGTNVGATIAAIESVGQSVSEKIILIAGGDSKAADLTPLQSPVSTYVSDVIVYGKDADRLAEALKMHARVKKVASLQAAVSAARVAAKHQSVVLFSPACSSLDQFKNYEARGEAFVAAITAFAVE